MPHYYTYDSNLSDRNKFTSTVERKLIDDSLVTKRYFSQLDTDVYFGAIHIDEMVAIDFTIAEPKLPIYGYNSFYPNRIVSGRRTLQGTFAINFTSTTYLLDILKNIDDSVMANDYEALVFRCPEEDSTGLGIGNSAIFSKMFDITISYGYGKEENKRTYNGCYQTIVGVQIVDYRQALDTEGNPILDMYSFIAKDIRYHDAIVEDETGDPGEEKEICPYCKNPISECTCNQTIITPPEYEFFNYHIDGERNALATKNEKPNYIGFEIDSRFYMSNGTHYISLCIKSVTSADFDIDTFKDVSINISSKSLGINSFTIPFKDDFTVGITKAQPLVDALRTDAVKIEKEFKRTGEFYGPIVASISFTVDINDKPVTISNSNRPVYIVYLPNK